MTPAAAAVAAVAVATGATITTTTITSASTCTPPVSKLAANSQLGLRFYIVAAGTEPGQGVAIARSLLGADGTDWLRGPDKGDASLNALGLGVWGLGFCFEAKI